MNLIQHLKKIFELTDDQPVNDRHALYDLEQVNQKMLADPDDADNLSLNADEQSE